MGYLQSADYANYGLAPDTTDDWVTVASALMENYCRRASLLVTQYTERVRLTAGAQTAQLTYLPLTALPPASLPLVTVQARFTQPRRGEAALAMQYDLQELWTAFSLPGSWVTVDPTTVDWTPDGFLELPRSVMAAV